MSIFTKSKRTFENQLQNEKTILLTRKHKFVLFVPLLIIFVLSLIPFIVRSYIPEDYFSVYWFLASIYFLTLWHLLFYNIMIYTLNTVAITNKRIIENQQMGFFRHKVDELEIHRIQDITIKVYGVIPEMLKFGDLEIQTAGTMNKFVFTQLPHPKRIKDAIRRINRSQGI